MLNLVGSRRAAILLATNVLVDSPSVFANYDVAMHHQHLTVGLLCETKIIAFN